MELVDRQNHPSSSLEETGKFQPMAKIFTDSTEVYISLALCWRETEEHVTKQCVESDARKSSFFMCFSLGLFKLGRDPKGTQP